RGFSHTGNGNHTANNRENPAPLKNEMTLHFRPTLKQLFTYSLLGLILSLTLLFLVIFKGSQRTILKIATNLREAKSTEVASRVSKYLNEAPEAISHFENAVEYGLVDPKNSTSIQAGLFSLLLANRHVSEASFTYGNTSGFDANDERIITPSSVGEVTLVRTSGSTPNGNEPFASRQTWFNGKAFVCKSEMWTKFGNRMVGTVSKETPCPNPTQHYTFTTPAKRDAEKQLFASDLHWSQIDDALPENQRRVEVSVQKAIDNTDSQFAGVLRVGLTKEELDKNIQHIAGGTQGDLHLIFLCDNQGRLITGFKENQQVAESDDDLRIVDDIPASVAVALKLDCLKDVSATNPVVSAEFRSDSKIYFCTFHALSEDNTQNWIVGIVVPRDYYLGYLLHIREQIYIVSFILAVGIIIVGWLILRGVSRAHSLILRETERMNAFEFSASITSSGLQDIAEVLTGLEKAKTAMRAMGKYVPVDLVRRLYHDGKEPVLGGDSADLSILFTDIKNFTQFAESASPIRLADILGQYLDVVATIIQNERGTIDKYIGDAVMAFWNAPETLKNHSIFACRAAIGCRDALEQLYLSPHWKDAPKFETRFGLHRGTASVGHFGSPSRFNYTAIGDSINLASRLEGLSKYYGTTIIASEAIYESTKEEFEFRLLDRVAVKGKTQGITIYELLSAKIDKKPRDPYILRYEEAFTTYLAGDFKKALSLLEIESTDSASRVLAVRCREFIEDPPTGEWDGVHIFDTK
ncbi:MAG: adenylate/guanylate cyclase domain-containing protein, partial [Chthoniobacterales bacterium]